MSERLREGREGRGCLMLFLEKLVEVSRTSPPFAVVASEPRCFLGCSSSSCKQVNCLVTPVHILNSKSSSHQPCTLLCNNITTSPLQHLLESQVYSTVTKRNVRDILTKIFLATAQESSKHVKSV
jgi:hypothetical protein